MLQPDFPGKFADSVHEVLSLSVDLLLQVVQLVASLDHFARELLCQLLFILKFILLRGVSLFNIEPLLILSFKLLLQPHLHDPLLLELTLGLHEILLLLECLLHGLITVQELLLHVLDLLEQLLLLALLLIRPLLLVLELLQQVVLLFLRHLVLLLDLQALLLELLLDLELLVL